MKKIAIFLCCIFLFSFSLFFVGCFETENVGEEGSFSQGDSSKGGEEGEEEEGFFTVKLNMTNGAPVSSMGDVTQITAVWTDLRNTTRYEASFNRKGVATSREADGEYRVSLSGLPEEYTYDPNAYQSTNHKKTVTVDIYEWESMPWSESGAGEQDSPPTVLQMGVYRFVFERANQSFYFWWNTSFSNKTIVKSLVDVTVENQIQPVLTYYSNINYLDANKPITSGGSYSAYTKNFRYEMELSGSQSVGFGVSIEAKPNTQFPVTLDVLIETEETVYGGVYDVVPEREPVLPDELRDGPADGDWRAIQPEGTFTLLADLTIGSFQDKNHFDEDMVVYDPDKGVYYLNKNYGVEGASKEAWIEYPVYARLARDVENTQESWILNTRDPDAPGISKKSNYLCPEVGLDYGKFIAKYFPRCNADGSMPIDEYLQKFLHDYSIATSRFKDGMGYAEVVRYFNNTQSTPYTSSDGGRWLWICGVYI